MGLLIMQAATLRTIQQDLSKFVSKTVDGKSIIHIEEEEFEKERRETCLGCQAVVALKSAT